MAQNNNGFVSIEQVKANLSRVLTTIRDAQGAVDSIMVLGKYFEDDNNNAHATHELMKEMQGIVPQLTVVRQGKFRFKLTLLARTVHLLFFPFFFCAVRFEHDETIGKRRFGRYRRSGAAKF